MKKKYHDMVYAYIQNKMGDLAPEVLSEEVKWKILFKIYRKKLRQQKKKCAALCERVGELQQTLLTLTEPEKDRRVPSHSCLTCANFIPYTTCTDPYGASHVSPAGCCKGRDIDNQEAPCPDWCEIGMCIYHDAAGKKYYVPEEEGRVFNAMLTTSCTECAEYDEDNPKQCKMKHRTCVDGEPAICGDFHYATEVNKDEEEPHFCYECRNSSMGKEATGKEVLKCDKCCWPKNPAYCGHFEERDNG